MASLNIMTSVIWIGLMVIYAGAYSTGNGWQVEPLLPWIHVFSGALAAQILGSVLD